MENAQGAARSERPVLVYDDKRPLWPLWVERWREIAGPRVEFKPRSEAAGTFPDLPPGPLSLVETDGRTTSGAGAVLRIYALSGEKRVLEWLYRHVSLLQALLDGLFGFAANHHRAAARLTRLLWGRAPYRPRYRRMRSIFLRALALTFLAAFWSVVVQVDGLISSKGILPVGEYLDQIESVLGRSAYRQFPTLLWLDRSDRCLHFLCWGGMALAACAAAGILPALCLLALWVFYLSLMIGGQEFLSFQWDILLLEAGLLGVLFSPWVVWLPRAKGEPSRGAVWLIRWLVFRLMLESGLVKLASGDPTWHTWEALFYHYETQPLPTWTSWYMHQLPHGFHSASTGAMFYAELVAPFFVFGPRRVRMLGFWSIVLLQVLIAATGNYGCFNLLTIVLCLALVEDRDWGRKEFGPTAPARWGMLRKVVVGTVGAVIVLVTTEHGLARVGWPSLFPAELDELQRAVEPFHSMNSYGLFAVMTTERPEIVVEGSDDGSSWRPYVFRWKPQDLDAPPRFTTPHMPRLDWQMWFAALARDCRRAPWFLAFEKRLLEGSPEVLGLLKTNPFPDHPPRFLRARLFLYHFTRKPGSAWWQREELDPYCPPVSLRGGG